MNISKKMMTDVFNKWLNDWAQDPEKKDYLLNEDGSPTDDYGAESTKTFHRIMAELKDGNSKG